MSGFIVLSGKQKTYEVAKLDLRNAGKGRVGLHYQMRDKAQRFDIVRVMNCETGRHIFAAAIGIRDGEPNNLIKLDLDMRNALGVSVASSVSFEVRKAHSFEVLWWFLSVKDPAVRIAAWLSAVSVILGVISVLLAVT